MRLLALLALFAPWADAAYTYDIQGCAGTARRLHVDGERSPALVVLQHYLHSCLIQLGHRY